MDRKLGKMAMYMGDSYFSIYKKHSQINKKKIFFFKFDIKMGKGDYWRCHRKVNERGNIQTLFFTHN